MKIGRNVENAVLRQRSATKRGNAIVLIHQQYGCEHLMNLLNGRNAENARSRRAAKKAQAITNKHEMLASTEVTNC